eukprot:TRINITY_DN37466_c0_g1_i1.p2 TRINITY_DN37466_c0_g1~~TRINITY_DN37466_c0_g1_i1.p2  ORF type:complete len:107 (-),score=5.59 TRINITY_DN37466_c0_g1_i1:148-468(-)
MSPRSTRWRHQRGSRCAFLELFLREFPTHFWGIIIVMALSPVPLLWARRAIPMPANNPASTSIEQRVAKMAVHVTIAISANTSAMRRLRLKPESHGLEASIDVSAI